MSADITPEMQQPVPQSPPPGAPPPPPPPERGQPPQQPQQQIPPGTVTADAAGRRWWWDGTQWRPVVAARRNFRWAWSLIVLVGVVVGYAVIHNTGGTTQTISNTKIDSSTQIEFDYHASTNCNNLTFAYTFKDSSGSTVDTWNGESSHSVQSGRDYHITASADPQNGKAIASGATSFDVTPTCHDQ